MDFHFRNTRHCALSKCKTYAEYMEMNIAKDLAGYGRLVCVCVCVCVYVCVL